jgi:hypothetical protein
MRTTVKKEEAFAELVREYENLWVALIEKGGEELVVGAGRTPKEALAKARDKGFTDVVLFSVPSFSSSYAY